MSYYLVRHILVVLCAVGGAGALTVSCVVCGSGPLCVGDMLGDMCDVDTGTGEARVM